MRVVDIGEIERAFVFSRADHWTLCS